MDKEQLWARFQRRLRYTDEQTKTLRADARWRKMVEETPEFMTHRMIAEVVKAEGCHAKHRVGDRFVFDANGCLISEESPSRICLWALAPLATHAAVMYERLAAKLPLDGMLFDHAHCIDTGPGCGWGQILMRTRIVGPDISKEEKSDN